MTMITAYLAMSSSLTATEIVEAALKKAQIEKKNVLIDFGASWCPWCRKTDTLFNESPFAKKIQSGYVIAHITVRERPEKAALENAGWEPIMAKYRGAKDLDIPYLVVVNPKGKKLVDSYRVPEGEIPGNAGYPKTPVEIDAFLKLIGSTSKTFSATDLKALGAYFADQAAKPGSGH